ncbi:MAG: 50S ribosomal protein L9 [Verrucomicrobia bacterium]|nr:50S ribosomal protein L9 [Verrucomicrobiota bacterium]
MASEVLLMEDVKDLGSEGDVVKVSDGYARNYLIPKKLAAPVSQATRRRLARLQETRLAEAAAVLDAAKKQAAKLAKISCTIPVKAGADEKLFGSVTVTDIEASLKAQGIELDRSRIRLEAPIKELGIFGVPVDLHEDVEATLKVWVVEE